MSEDNWFQKVAREAEATEKAIEAYHRTEEKERQDAAFRRSAAHRSRISAMMAEIPPATPASSAEAAAAKEMFESVATGKAPVLGTGTPPPWFHSGGYVPGTVGSMRPPRIESPIQYDRWGNDVTAGTGRFPKPPTPDQGLKAILDAVKSERDPDAQMKLAGEWITRVTNGITAILRESDTPE